MTDDATDVPAGDALRHRALAHPLRYRVLIALGAEPATVSQLARTLGAQKGSVAHHLRVLVDAGFVRAGAARQVRGGTEQYYERAVRQIRTGGNDPQSTAAMLGAVGAELAAAADDPLLHLRYIRLTAAQAAQLRAALERLVEELDEADDGQDRYGVLVSLYRPT